MATVSPLHSDNGRQLLDVIDRLKTLPSISHEIALPQIVVVGQQSSGKSSVLKAISNIDFPTNEGLCTHFATEIVCRRESQETTKAQIIPAAAVDDRYHEQLEDFSSRWSQIPRDQNIADIMDDATRVMGLDGHRQISKDKLRLEFSGPKQDHISLIDLPGLFEQTKPEQRKEDRDFVDEMVTEYIGGSQTIILAVVSGRCDVTLTRVFEMFESHSARTLGVVTGPDLVESGTPKATDFSQLMANMSFKTGHGWHVLRNLSHSEEQNSLDRDEVEANFFAEQSLMKNSTWAGVPAARIGIKNLKNKLASMLQNSISDGLPQIQRQLRKAHDACEQDLKLLGHERTTVEQQRDYLADKSELLRRITIKELNGGNGQPSLRSRIRNANDRFAENMIKFGAHWHIGTEPTDSVPADLPVRVEAPLPITEKEWLSTMLAEVSNSRGREMDGLVDPVWVGRMFLRQSRKWKTLAECHVEEAFAIVETYFADVIEKVVGVENAERFLVNTVEPELQKRSKALKTKVEELLTPYSTEYPRTLSRAFRSQDRDLSSILSKAKGKHAQTHNTIAQFTCDMLEYYTYALTIFIDNIESLAIENVLLSGLEDMMTASKAYKMPQSELAALASESEEVVEKRRVLSARMQEYQKASNIICRFSIQRHSSTHSANQSITEYHTATPSMPATLESTNAMPPANAVPQSPVSAGSSSSSTHTASAVHTPEQPDRVIKVAGSSTRSTKMSRILAEADGRLPSARSSPSWPEKGTITNSDRKSKDKGRAFDTPESSQSGGNIFD